ncbi:MULTISPECIES: MBL fold metallo-hydrolase [Arcobacteraceae]|uniref:5-phospho-alpha-D-ribosyl 1,2-cyclic phosphate phosphodiesterase n=1 Tax=Malaciobacter marinus TaxID=505249 RepID=A0AB37A0P7_9BACT|nr:MULTISPECIES: MBL fold metallo-hydrolase [Arcobacteraceae]PPK62611.1 5-phospho-alpha-D-ribosyl 1,2-cyclic phosphate phosphodiesterase [Malaciobacter marinus]
MFNMEFLGTANASGIPVYNCQCEICKEYRQKGTFNNSTSAYIKCSNNEVILLDAGDDDLSQKFDGNKIKAVLLTHFHADHALGLLKLRYGKDKIVCYHPKDEQGFADLFRHKLAIEYRENRPFQGIVINDLIFTPIPLIHSKNTTGYLVESQEKTIAYLTDCAGIEKHSMEFLLSKNIDECYIDACHAPHYPDKNHLNYEEATKLLDKISAKKSFLIHGSHETLEYIKKNNVTLKYHYLL